MSNSLPVVVGVDGSESARQAVRWAAAEAGRRGTRVRLVHAVDVPTGYSSAFVDPRALRTALLERGDTWLAEAREAAEQAAPDVPVDVALEPASVVPTLVRESRDAALVVLGSRGLGGFTGLLVGSTAVELAGRAASPVVVVPAQAVDEASTGPVVVGVDGTPAGDAAIGFGFAAASARGTGLVAVHTWSDLVLELAFAGAAEALDFSRVAEEAAVTLGERLAGWEERYPNVLVTRVVERSRPARALLRHAAQARLIVVGSRGRGGFRGLLLGSTSQHLLVHAPCPVAVVRTVAAG